MPSTTPGRIAAGIAGATGTSSLGVSAFAVFRMTSARVVPGGMWAALVALSVATALVSSLGLFLEYKLKKFEVEGRDKQAQWDVELRRSLGEAGCPGIAPRRWLCFDAKAQLNCGTAGSADRQRSVRPQIIAE